MRRPGQGQRARRAGRCLGPAPYHAARTGAPRARRFVCCAPEKAACCAPPSRDPPAALQAAAGSGRCIRCATGLPLAPLWAAVPCGYPAGAGTGDCAGTDGRRAAGQGLRAAAAGPGRLPGALRTLCMLCTLRCAALRGRPDGRCCPAGPACCGACASGSSHRRVAAGLPGFAVRFCKTATSGSAPLAPCPLQPACQPRRHPLPAHTRVRPSQPLLLHPTPSHPPPSCRAPPWRSTGCRA